MEPPLLALELQKGVGQGCSSLGRASGRAQGSASGEGVGFFWFCGFGFCCLFFLGVLGRRQSRQALR